MSALCDMNTTLTLFEVSSGGGSILALTTIVFCTLSGCHLHGSKTSISDSLVQIDCTS